MTTLWNLPIESWRSFLRKQGVACSHENTPANWLIKWNRSKGQYQWHWRLKKQSGLFISLLAQFLTMTNQQTVLESCITGNELKQLMQSCCMYFFSWLSGVSDSSSSEHCRSEIMIYSCAKITRMQIDVFFSAECVSPYWKYLKCVHWAEWKARITYSCGWDFRPQAACLCTLWNCL